MDFRQTLDENIEGLRNVIEDDQIFDFYKDVIVLIAQEYATECVKASLEKAGSSARIVKTGNSGSYFDGSVDKQSITSPDNIVLL